MTGKRRKIMPQWSEEDVLEHRNMQDHTDDNGRHQTEIMCGTQREQHLKAIASLF
ncbi:hypothetical protein TSUD_140170 [Trifolium subterraneum]|uniref:Uncharacterized protein n=1 Tax=Trifolium subterraneum TaxID=3900 RepID=A0A2Z6MP62_TRISU|nr:hypothetical protein TSUD_140170 [Trifolium subterraneum]